MKVVRTAQEKIDLRTLQRTFEKDASNASKQISILLGSDIEESLINELMWHWRTTMQPLNDGTAAVKKQTIEFKLNTIQLTIQKLNAALGGLKSYNRIDIKSIETIAESVNSSDIEVKSISSKISNLQKQKAFLITIEKDKCDNKKVLFYALIQVFCYGEKLGLCIGKAYAGKGNKNKLFEFVKIITGINDYKKLHRYYSKYKKLPQIPSIF